MRNPGATAAQSATGADRIRGGRWECYASLVMSAERRS
jgi:hypothetical protein